DEYDFRILFKRPEKCEGVVQVMTIAGQPFAWLMGGWDNTVQGFDTLDDMRADDNKSSSRASLVPGKLHSSTIQVRKGAVTVFVAGAQVARWDSGVGKLGQHDRYRLRGDGLLGLVSFNGVT